MAEDLLRLSAVIPILPLASGVLLVVFGKRLREPIAGWIATIVMAATFVGSVSLFFALRTFPSEDRVQITVLFDWLRSGALNVELGFLVDPLSITMILFITGVGMLIHLYAIGYMHDDPRFTRFFGYLNLFAGSMLVLVLGSNFLVTFLGWEGVGVCSYLLISFWFERNSAALAGKKAFVTNRVGDFGFMLAMFLIFQRTGTLSYENMSQNAELLTRGSATAIALLLFLGAIGKSAQLPLHIWLPDAMEGPTPVSALIHAATMVTAGVYLVSRAHPYFQIGSAAQTTVAWVGGLTALFAATVALVSMDIKRVLAYSTISQLGYMFLAAGTGAYSAAIFHMVTNSFFKALLFLGAGSVMHGLRNEQDMRYMGALRKLMPVTAATFIVAWLAIAGIFPFAGFWSKDAILTRVFVEQNYWLWGIGIFTALLTAFYMTRQVMMVFYGNPRYQDDLHPHESPRVMLAPLMVLGVLATVGGALDLPFQRLEFLSRWLEPVFEGVPEPTESFATGFSLALAALFLAFIGIYGAYWWYRRGLENRTDVLPARLGVAGTLFQHAWYIDEAVSAAVRGPVQRFARFASNIVDLRLIDGAVNGIGITAQSIGRFARRAHTGLLRNYAAWIAVGAVALLIYAIVRAN